MKARIERAMIMNHHRGFCDELDQRTPVNSLFNPIMQAAYDQGKSDAILGDDISGVDDRPWPETRSIIMNSIR